jgi:cell division septum initiation protein DivIVA
MSRIAENTGIDLLFEDTLFGYDKQQVDAYVRTTTDRLQALAAEAQRLSTVEQELTVARADIARLTSEMTTLDPHVVIGPRLQQILRLAQDEAEGMRAQAAEELRRARIEGQTIRANATRDAADARRDFEVALHEHRRERHAAADEVLAQAQREAEQIVAAAHSPQTGPDRRSKHRPSDTAPANRDE